MSNTKKYIMTAVTLGLIAMSGALLISLTNLITKETIKQNEKNNIESGIKEVFDLGKNAKISDGGEVTGYQYIEHYYSVMAEANTPSLAGLAFRTTGSNMYGKISLIIGIGVNGDFKGLSIITNEQTYAATLVDNYIDPLNDGTREVADVSCGATYGAKLVRDMVNEVKEAYTSFLY